MPPLSPKASRALAPGLYERLITRALKDELSVLTAAGTAVASTKAVDPAEAHATLARHIESVVARALRGLPAKNRETHQAEIANRILALLAGDRDLKDAIDADEAVSLPPEELYAVRPITGDPAQDRRGLPRPLVPLSAADLLVNARGEPALAHALAHEIPSADSIELLCAFVRWHGLRVLMEPLTAHCRAGKRLRIITTVYTGSTERKALDWLVSLGAQVKVSFDTKSTRLHAKSWLFRRATGYSTAYIGSSNLSKSALLDGVEWNVRLSEVGSPDVLAKFDATFAGYWASTEYEDYTATLEQTTRFDRAIAADRDDSPDAPLTFLEVEPWPHQREILEKLDAERKRHGRWKNLVVAATGTGKTIVAALDYKRLRDEGTLGSEPRLLFVAHRQEILRQSLGAFRQVLRLGDFGELYVAGDVPSEWRHVFGSVQSLSQMNLERLPPEAFDVVIVDEFHRAGAPTYKGLLGHLRPKVLLGLTATPERTDSEDILHYFDGHIAAEMRLWDALERNLVCPFQYFGVHDNSDLRAVRFARGLYDVGELDKLYTGNDARVALVLKQLEAKHRDFRRMRALGFCVSVAHAEFMARRFTEAGLRSLAVSADTKHGDRAGALSKLRKGEVRALFAVDVFNEGVDLPEVDTLLFLRPTESALVFLRQLGRGLRRWEGKDCVTVLDFIGHAHQRFRFDLRYRAVTGSTRTEVEKEIEQDFPFLPAGCSMQLDRVARDIVLQNIRSAIPSRRPAMVRELRGLLESDRFRGRVPSLREFLDETGLELGDVYKSGCWSGLQRDAGVSVPAPGPHERTLGGAIERLLHVEDPLRIAAYKTALAPPSAGGVNESDRLLLAGLHFGLMASVRGLDTLESSLGLLQQHPAIVQELGELLPLLDDLSVHITYPLDKELRWKHRIPLSVHARHTMRDVLTAFGMLRVDGSSVYEQKGIFRDERTNSDLFFVTLEKSERDYSPSTLYKDYAISPAEFHWESQSGTSQQSPTGQRYIRHRERGGHILLFVRQRRKQDGRTVPYTFLGPCDYVSHSGDRPVAFVWRLRRAMPAGMFREAKVAVG